MFAVYTMTSYRRDRNVYVAQQVRQDIRTGVHPGATTGLAPGNVQTNLVVLPREYAFDFLLFAQRNPKPCPIIEVIESGFEATKTAPMSDLRTDISGYRLFADGKHVDSASDATPWWREDLVSFLLGCSFSFEEAFLRAKLPVRHIEVGRNVPMYETNLACTPAGIFSGPMVVTCRPMPKEYVDQAADISSAYPHAHGGPVHIGNPEGLGISDIHNPEFGDPPHIEDGDVPMFWACGVTPQLALQAAKPWFAITHEPGCMFVTDLSDESPENTQ